MKPLKGFIKLIEALSLFLVPVVVFYWFLTLVNLQVVKPFIAIIGQLLLPFLSFIKAFTSFEVQYEEVMVDFAPFVLAGILVAIFLVFSGLEKLLDNLELAMEKRKKEVQKALELEHQELQKIKYLEELARNKVTYLSLKFRQKETENAYLYVGREDIFGEGILGTLINDMLNKSKDYNGKKVSEFPNEDGTYNFIFYNITEAIDYAFFVNNKVMEINKEVLDLSKRFHYGIACHCYYSESTEKTNLEVTKKFLNLGGENQIIVSELFKKKYDALKDTTNLVFASKGIYNIEDFQAEVFSIGVK